MNIIASLFFDRQFYAPVPRIFHTLFTAILGFLTGMLIWSFTTFLLLTTPYTNNSFTNKIGFNQTALTPNVSYLCFWCDLYDCFARSGTSHIQCEDLVAALASVKSLIDQPNQPEPTPKTAAASLQPALAAPAPDPDSKTQDVANEQHLTQ